MKYEMNAVGRIMLLLLACLDNMKIEITKLFSLNSVLPGVITNSVPNCKKLPSLTSPYHHHGGRPTLQRPYLGGYINATQRSGRADVIWTHS